MTWLSASDLEERESRKHEKRKREIEWKTRWDTNQIVVELNAVKALEDIHCARVKSYLRATGPRVGLLLNSSAPTLVVKRIVL